MKTGRESATAGQANPLTQARSVRRYTEWTAPLRYGLAGRLVFALKQDAREATTRALCPNTTGRVVLDIGAGDGRLLRAILRGQPRRICLIDLSGPLLDKAAAPWRARGIETTTRIADIQAEPVPEAPDADIVLCIGVSEYVADLPALLDRLTAHASATVLVDLTKRATVNARVRRLVLGAAGVALTDLAPSGLERLLAPFRARGSGWTIRVVDVGYTWLVRLDRAVR
jgi:2-polyprenyl-3-methyl-5-hydroxy-6-metoxy-1,4-benzoquinol methylase